MSISVIEIEAPKAKSVTVTEDTLTVDLSDGRTISVPLVWFPRLVHAKPDERKNWRLILIFFVIFYVSKIIKKESYLC